MESSNFDLSTDERKNLLELWRKRNEACLKLLVALGTCTIIAWYIYPLLDDLDYNLMVPMRIPYDYKTEALYPATYVGVIIVFSYISYFVMVNDLIIQAHIMHLLCQFAVLNDSCVHILRDCKANFKHENEDKLYANRQFQETYINRLGDLVNQHIFILKNTLQLREILSAPMLAQLAVSTTLICSIGYQVAMLVGNNVTKWLMSFLFLGYNMFVLFIMCRWCEELTIQSEKIGEAIYFSGWERGIATVPGVRIRILLIMARAQKPLVLSAGRMYDLSLAAYANIVKTSYSALTMLLRLR
ncbi:odorant receptor 13a-like [Leptidea sinapis]|uniref:odorant receptor 13a-like n=1 Tax=Leptidea sinapis TaxID=189913 RepID=UPI0021C39648|nr:odorant receptor 13a-like [Leptidea sinapis]